MTEIETLTTKIAALDIQIAKAFTDKSADDTTMKAKLKELSDMYHALAQKQNRQDDDPCRVFGKKSIANEFMDFLACGPLLKLKSINPTAQLPDILAEKQANYLKTKATGADLYQGVNGGAPAPANPGSNGTGGYLVPTQVSQILSQLMLQGFQARKLLTVREVVGNYALPIATNQAKAYFVGADNNPITQTDFGGGVSGQPALQPNVTVSPATIGAYMALSGKLLYNSAIDLSMYVAENLAAAAGLLEDQLVIYGDGSDTWGKQTGLLAACLAASQVVTTSKVATSYGNLLVPLDTTPSTGDSLPAIEDLIALRIQAHESVDGNGTYQINREFWAYLCALKANGSGQSGLFYLNPYTQGRVTAQGEVVGQLNGVDVTLWNRLSSGKNANGGIYTGANGGSAAGDWGAAALGDDQLAPIAIYGDLKKAATLVFNRNMFIDVDRSIGFLKGEYTWRLLEDCGVGVNLPKAVAILAVTGHAS